MKLNFIPTNEIYRRLAASPPEERARLFEAELLAPFATSLEALGGRMGQSWLQLAAQFNLFMPDELGTVPPALHILEAADAWTIAADSLQHGMDAFMPHAERIGLARINAGIFLCDPAREHPGGAGYSGFGAIPGDIWLAYFRPHEDNLRKLPGLAVHELHHTFYARLFPHNIMTMTVWEYCLMEGLAESFATALYGEEMLGFYVTDITPDDLEKARSLIGGALDASGFNLVRGYIFGDSQAASAGYTPIGMPDFGGYAVGYHAVQAYMRRTGRDILTTTLTPPAEILRACGYFG